MSRTSAAVHAAAALFVGLLALESFAPNLFVPIVGIALLHAPILNWRVWHRLRSKRLLRTSLGLNLIVSLQTAERIAFLTAVGSSVMAALGLFVVLRELDPFIFAVLGLHVVADDSQVPLVLLAYPPILATGAAFLWQGALDDLEGSEVARGRAGGIGSGS